MLGSALFTTLSETLRGVSQGMYDRLVSLVVLSIIAVTAIRKATCTQHILVKWPENPFGSSPFAPSSEYRWDRSDLTESICCDIQASKSTPVIIVGPSGVGKSFLMTMVTEYLQTLLVPGESQHWNTKLFERYDGGLMIPRELRASGRVPTVLVLDQFEQFLGYSQERDRDSLIQWLRDFMNGLQRQQLRFVFVVREDAFYQMVRFLGDVQFRRLDISGIPEDSDAGRVIRKRLQEAIGGPAEDVWQALVTTGNISPLEMRIVGYHLADIRKDLGVQIDANYLRYQIGGKDGVIRSYFGRCIDRLKDPDTGMAVLFALALSGLYRRALDATRIAYITHRDLRVIEDSLKELKDEALLRNPNGRYELIHDFVAAHAREATGLRLNPVDRDNILYFTEIMSTRGDVPNYSKPDDNRRDLLPLSDPLFLILASVLSLRLLFPDLVHLLGLSMLDPVLAALPQTSSRGFLWIPRPDPYFFPVAISVLAWMYYISELHGRVLKRIENDSSAWYSYSLWVAACLGGICIQFIPSLFMTGIFVFGVLLGLKLWMLSCLDGLARASQDHFKNDAKGLVWFNLFGAVVSIATMRVYLKSDPSEYFSHFGWLMVLLVTISMTAARTSHVAGSAPNRFLALVDRRSGAAPH